ncbi:cysteine-rich receptor-like protein kinase 44 [Aegilops tauschii subsp. strangulata]|uniref:non-specific serine/threonine protein kinase n=4 Tax=Aegilops tauschii TaxID=37682 RepID=A0A453JGA1_AEGTS|nr:putative receptor-like protein kinase At4g00960 [Aegilops tauschii subsp. strangulata]XP_045084037.1 putative receptor-like protein kinase At4g00960 [Aegilops tauschii subsp. strangulata]
MEYLFEKMSSSDKDAKPMQLHLLKTITEDFSEKMKVGGGGYGEVYKGVLNGDEIAVKKLFPVPGLNDEAFENEFRNLKKVQHENIIRMIGYCYEIAHKDVEYEGKLVFSAVIERALCFEYMKGGSLAKHISDKSCILDWPTTYKIIHGTCEGLHYLHKGQVQKIFHLDLKPDNVLLDENFVPKIGDFGLSKLFGTSYTHQISAMKGTVGFMPQEYIHNRKVSPKNDVFSLGVIIFHMMAGEKGYGDYWDARRRPNFSKLIQQDFIDSVQEYWKTKMQATKGYRWDEADLLGVTKCIDMAMRCVEDDRDKRPYMTEIISELKELDSKVGEMLNKDPKPTIHPLRNCVNGLGALKQNKSPNNLGKDIVVDPSLELCFPFEPNKDIRCCLQLINKVASSHIAFNINTDVEKYLAQPHKGIIAPYSKCYITLTLREEEVALPNMQCFDMLVVQTVRVSKHFTSDEITQDFLQNISAMDEVILPIHYVGLDQ